MTQCNATSGCSGQIVDGFCDQCGSAPLPVSQPVAATASARQINSAPAAQSNSCSCGGKYVDGFCDQCGNAPAASSQSSGGSVRSHKTGSTLLSGKTTGSRRGSDRSRVSGTRKHLGLGLVSVPDVPKSDPLKALMAEAKVPENKRFCSGYKATAAPARLR